MVSCKTCKKLVSSSANQCPHCGEADVFGNAKRISQEMANCQTCKKPVSSSAQRCPHCGEPDVFGNAKRIGQEIVDTARRQDLEKLGCFIFPILLIIFFIIFMRNSR